MFGKEIALFSKSMHRKEGERVRKNMKTADTGQRNAKRCVFAFKAHQKSGVFNRARRWVALIFIWGISFSNT